LILIILASLGQVARDLNTSPTITNLSVALYMLSMAIFPLWWSAFSEAFGRRSIYLISFILFVLFSILSAVSNSIATLVVMRMLSGGAAASVQAVGAGTIADVWEPKERGRAMGIFYLGPLCGPLFAPIIGGALAQRWNWRATLWFLVIYGGKWAQTAFRDGYSLIPSD
jgi:multidrug resistance protein